MRTYRCRNCNKEHQYRGMQFSNLYCDNKCQGEYQRTVRIKQWLEEGKDWPGQIPKWAKHTLAEVNGDCCSVCGITEYNGLPIVLECDHIDGNHTNNSVKNLRLICPNCHSQTSTYKNRNKGNGRTVRRTIQ
jgi:hypothetical protein